MKRNKFKSFITGIFLAEAEKRKGFDIRYKDIGEIPFSKSTLNDPHIMKIIQHVSEQTKVPSAKILADMQSEILKLEKCKELSPILYETMALNAANTEAFNYVMDAAEHSEFQRTIFDKLIFYKLVDEIQFESINSGFLPLKAPDESFPINKITAILIPNQDSEIQRKYAKITTACATNHGDFVFNKIFMQKLIDFAKYENLQMDNPKYVSQGGIIPDEYGYIETLIVHELVHYAFGDFQPLSRSSLYTHSDYNITQDFRNNYLLVSSGYKQLPTGLFSDHINFNRQKNTEEMLEIVKREIKKLPPGVCNLSPHDNHLDIPNDAGQKEGEESKPGKEGEESKPGKEGQSASESKPTETPSESAKETSEEIYKRIKNNMKKRNENIKNPHLNNQPSSAPETIKNQEFTNISSQIDLSKNTINWRALMKKMFSSFKITKEPSYSQMDPGMITGIDIGRQLGSYAIKPGLRTYHEKLLKICLVIDTSGSMHGNIAKVLAEAQSLLNILKKNNSTIGIIYFSDSASYFQVNLKTDTYKRCQNAQDMMNKKYNATVEKGWKSLVSSASTGGTSFGTMLADNISLLLKDKWSVMIFSDNDITHDSNYTNFEKLYLKHPKNVFFIAASKIILENVIKKFSEGKAIVPTNWTYMQ